MLASAPMRRMRMVGIVCSMVLAACGGDDDAGGDADAGAPDAAWPEGYVPPSEQRPGDPAAGYTALVNEGYVRCGVPWSIYSTVFGPPSADQIIDGRVGRNQQLPYNFTAFTTAEGVEAVAPNCLQCHAEYLNGELVIGLGNVTADYTIDTGTQPALACGLVSDPDEKAHCNLWAERVETIAPFIITATVGVNPADNIAAILFAHRDPDTLAWSSEPLLEPPPMITVPVDVPPWWRMAKKHSMFYNGAGRGDHARIMMSASALCTDNVAEAESIDAYFPDIRAYIYSLQPPAWPYDVDTALAAEGEAVFAATCARCHGSYGDGGAYPNLVIPLEEIGTDDTLVLGTNQFAARFVDWFNSSFYGAIAELAPETGYTAPPLDGVWATAPYLHNGSIPTIAALLDSSTRPTYWRRSFDQSDYDPDAMGWVHEVLETGHADEPSATRRKLIYDTTNLGYSNAGHTFGDALSADDRAAVTEYLKTL